MENRSEIARIRVQIDLELDALERFMRGTAIVANHAVISHRIQRLGGCMDDLAEQIGEDAAVEEICEKYNRLKEREATLVALCADLAEIVMWETACCQEGQVVLHAQ
jgi:hypothetical protein